MKDKSGKRIRMSKKERIRQRWAGREDERFARAPTGRGNIRTDEVDKVKAYMRQHPEGVTAVVIAKNVGCSQARARGLLDYLSGGTVDSVNTDNSFLVSMDDEVHPPIYRIFKDKEKI